MLLTRIISAVVLGPLFLFIVYKGGLFLLFATGVLTLLALRELFGMVAGLGLKSWKISGYVGGLILVLGAYLEQGRFLFFLFALWLIYCLVFFVFRYPQQRIEDLSFNFFAVTYVALLFSHIILLRGLNQGIYLTFLAIGLTWATDTGAYFVGRVLGRHKLAPLVSPNKTVEGAIGGVLAAVAAAFIVGKLLPDQSLTPGLMCVLASAVGISAQLGDLVESALKRFAGVKDSGWLIPGHGGVLDRFDSILFTVPAVYYLFVALIIS